MCRSRLLRLVFLMALSIGVCHADVVQITGLSSQITNDSIVWSQFGNFAHLPNGTGITSTFGQLFT